MPQLSRSATLSGYAAVATDAGLDPYAMVIEAGLPLACLSDPDLKISSTAIVRLLEASAAKAGAPDFGLRLAATRAFTNLGAVGLLAREQPTVRQAIATIASNFWAQVNGGRIEVEDSDDLVIIKAVITTVEAGEARQATELLTAMLARFVERFQAPGWRPEMILFAHPAPPNISRHLGLARSPPLFEQPFSGIVVNARDLDRPVPGADPTAADQLSRYLRHISGGRAQAFEDIVREQILVLLPRGACSVQRVARQLAVDRRTVHRRLAAGGASFERLVREVRLELARAYLKAGDRPMHEISDLLGFSCPSAFSRWKRNALVGDLSPEV